MSSSLNIKLLPHISTEMSQFVRIYTIESGAHRRSGQRVGVEIRARGDTAGRREGGERC